MGAGWYDEAERPQEQRPVEVSDPGETGRGRNEGSRDLLNKDRWREAQEIL